MSTGDAIAGHALIGDGRSAALVNRDGTIDWLCWPRFDSPSLFGALLDPAAGAFTVAAVGARVAGRRYVAGTNVLETVWESTGGTLAVADFAPARAADDRPLAPGQELIRRAACVRGESAVRVTFVPRPEYGRGPVAVRRGAGGFRLETRAGLVLLQSTRPGLDVAGGGDRVEGQIVLREGEALSLSLSLSEEDPAVLVGAAHADAALAQTVAYWRRWVQPVERRAAALACGRDAVVRSALALKLMGHAPSGAIVAAPTTSLPETPGGELNWDYRYCWLRDAAFTTRALLALGLRAEAQAFVSWLLHATRLSAPSLQVLYDVFGRAPPRERTLPWLAGFEGARPVRVGNAADAQLQLDLHGEVIDAVAQLHDDGAPIDRETATLLIELGRYVCDNWRRDDHGLWEARTAPLPHTHSRLLCWVALDRLCRLHDRGQLARGRAPIDRFREERARIARELHDHAWRDELGSHVDVLDGRGIDAALLLLSFYGFEPADGARMRGTVERVRRELGRGGLVHRNAADRARGEGAFVACGFWLAETLARAGDRRTARAVFAAGLRAANDVGLLAEEVDPETGEALGNFPQAFSHLALISAAVALDEAAARRPRAAAAQEASP